MPHYKLTSPSGKSYHGITCGSVKNRITRHCRDANKGSDLLLHKAIRKYGIDNFKVEVLSETTNRSELARLEVEGIAKDNTFKPNGYNLTRGGDGASGRLLNAASRKILSEARSENWCNEEYRKRMLQVVRNLPAARAAAKSSKSNAELELERQRRSLGQKLSWINLDRSNGKGDAHAKKLAAARASRSSEEIAVEKANRSAAAKARWEKPGHREKVAAAKKASAA